MRKFLLLYFILLFGSFVYAVEDRSDTITPDFQIAPFSQVDSQNAVGIDNQQGVFQTGNTTELESIVADQNYSHMVGFLTISNNNPGGFEIAADGSNNSEGQYVLHHSQANNDGEHVMLYSLSGFDVATDQDMSGFGSEFRSGDTTDTTDSSDELFTVASPTKATQDGIMGIMLIITGAEILDAFNTEEDNESYTDIITLTLTET